MVTKKKLTILALVLSLACFGILINGGKPLISDAHACQGSSYCE